MTHRLNAKVRGVAYEFGVTNGRVHVREASGNEYVCIKHPAGYWNRKRISPNGSTTEDIIFDRELAAALDSALVVALEAEAR